MLTLHGKTIVGSVAIGPVHFFRAPERRIDDSVHTDTDNQLRRFEDAVKKVAEKQNDLYEQALEEAGEDDAAIFQVHAMMLEDEDLIDSAEDVIRDEQRGAEYAVREGFEKIAGMFEAMDDEYMKARSADIRDLEGAVIDELLGITDDQYDWDEPAVLFAEDLAPSETVKLDKSKLLGIVTEGGSATSHTAILARSMNIPTIIKCEGVSEELDGKTAVIDGYSGSVLIDPDEKTLHEMEQRRDADRKAAAELASLKGKESVTKDGRKVRVFANIGGPDDIDAVKENDAEGIGLFRSEFVYLNSSDYPTEDEQFEAYRKVLEAMAPSQVIIRTCDIGADKMVSYMGLEPEPNPALGLRAIRICLTRKDFFKTQLRALLRASAYGNLGIMFPMIISAGEIRAAKEILEECRSELLEEGVRIGDFEIGIMVETPAAAIIADELAEECDFFSIGTNDLTQYTLAIDRQNDNLDDFLDTHHPAVLKEIRMTVEAGHRHGTWVGICGELGADLTLTETFLKMGVDELSVNAKSVLPLRKKIRETDFSAADNEE